MIEQWFSVPILYEDNLEEKEKIQKEIDNVLSEIRKNNLKNPWQDNVLTTFKFENLVNDINTYKLDTLKSVIERFAKEYVEKCSITPYTKKLILYNSWFNFYNKGMFQFNHTHTFANLSGVYYYKTNEQDGNIVFENPNIYTRDRASDLGIPEIQYQPKVGRLLLFPSWLVHRVLANNTDNERISISFNLRYGGIAQLGEQ